MKIREDIKHILSGQEILITKFSISKEKKLGNEIINNSINIKLGNIKLTKCKWCKENNTNWCWNCEKPHCDKHAKSIMIKNIPIINTLCLDCAKEFEKLIRGIK